MHSHRVLGCVFFCCVSLNTVGSAIGLCGAQSAVTAAVCAIHRAV